MISSPLPGGDVKSSLKFIRRSRGLTLEALAELTGISPSYLSRLEAGSRRLNVDLLDKLSLVLECKKSELLEGDEGVRPKQGWCGGRAASLGDTGKRRVRDSEVDANAAKRDLPVYNVFTIPESLVGGGSVPASNNLEEHHLFPPTIDLISPVSWIARPPQLLGVRTAFALCMRDGESAPKYMVGDILFVHPNKPLSLRCPIVIITKDDRAIVRQFVGWGADSVLLSNFSAQKDFGIQVLSLPRKNILSVYRIIGSFDGGCTLPSVECEI